MNQTAARGLTGRAQTKTAWTCLGLSLNLDRIHALESTDCEVIREVHLGESGQQVLDKQLTIQASLFLFVGDNRGWSRAFKTRAHSGPILGT